MGKIRIKKMGIEELEHEEREKRRRQREQKRIRQEGKKEQKIKQKDTRAPGLKGGERVVSMTSEEEIEKLAKITEEEKKIKDQLKKGKPVEEEKKKKTSKKRQRIRSQKYKKIRLKVDIKKEYPIKEAVKLLKEISYSRFNGTVETHLNIKKQGVRGTVTFPHGIGKKRRVAIADDKLIKKVKEGKIDFDILVAHPSIMPQVAQVARILGPKGLMPNPKAGTISDKPEELKKELEGGKISYRTEAKQPIIHQSIGKVDFKDKEIIENFEALISAIDTQNIKSAFISATMSPGIKVELTRK